MLNNKFVKKLKEPVLVVTNIVIDTAGKLNIIYKSNDTITEPVREFFVKNIDVLLLKNCGNQYDFLNDYINGTENGKSNEIILSIEATNINVSTTITVSRIIHLENDIVLLVDSYGDFDVNEKGDDKAEKKIDKPFNPEEIKLTDWIKSFFKNEGFDYFFKNNWFDMSFPTINMLGLPVGCDEYEMKYKTNDDGTFTCTSKVNGKETTKTYKIQEV